MVSSNSALKLAYLLSQFPAANHTYLLREIRTLRRLGLDVRVASIRPPDRPPEAMTPEELEEIPQTHYIKSLSLLSLLGAHLVALFSHPGGYWRGLLFPLRTGRGDVKKTLYAFFYFLEAVAVGRWMETNGLSHLHVHFSSTVGLIVATVFPVTVSFTFHGPAEFYDPAGFLLAEKIAAAKFVCAISSFGCAQLMRLARHEDWEKIELSPLGVDPSVLQPREFRQNPDPFELVCVGRLAPEKAQRVLIAAVAQLAAESRRLRLRLVGDGPDRRSLEQDAATRGLGDLVVFEGLLDQARVLSVYAGADIFVLPSFAEGLPVVLMEAMATEIPCVATSIAGVPELIRDGIDGLLVPASDERALAAAIGRLMDDPELRRRIGAAARQRVLRDYGLAANTLRLAGVFSRRLLDRPLELEAQPGRPATTMSLD